MKMTPEHYAKLEAGCKAVIAAHPDIAATYAKAGLTPKRRNWDILDAATIDGVTGSQWVCSLYSYLNDDHVDTALRRIMANHLRL